MVGGCGVGGWMQWPAVLKIIGFRKRETRKIKNNKERIFKWNIKKKIEVLMEWIL